MRRREAPPLSADAPPVELTRFRYREWTDGSEPVERDEWPDWHDIRARRRWMDARRAWCVQHGRDFAATFHPEWATWHSGGARIPFAGNEKR